MSEVDLDDEQLRAVEASERAIAVLAGPGSGKTRTLAHRAAYLHAQVGSDRVLALTFTNKAAAEMKSRALSASSVASDRLRAGTFHGFGMEFLRGHGGAVGIGSDFDVVDPEEAQEIAMAAAAATSIDDHLARWNYCRLRCLEIDGPELEFGQVYEAAKREAAVVDFDDLVVYPGQILRENDNLAAAYAARYHHVLVDEFQDTNAAQFQTVRALAPYTSTVSVFADDDQAIFRFVGAEAENINRFVDQLEAVVYPLTCNYRCRNQIVGRANDLIAADPNPSGRIMRANVEGGEVHRRTFASTAEEARILGKEIEDRLGSADRLPGEIAILVRSGHRASELVDDLTARSVPVSDWRGDTYDSSARRVFTTGMAVLRGKLSDRQAIRLCDLMDEPAPDERDTHALLMSLSHKPLASGLLDVRESAFAGAPASQIASHVQELLELEVPEAAAGLRHLAAAVADFEAYDSEFSLDDLLADLVLSGGGRSPTASGGVKVASLHKTKGLEWPVVYLLGLEEGHSPDRHAESAAEIADERRLCFVGICRAEDELNVTFSQRLRSYGKRPSRFLSEMQI